MKAFLFALVLVGFNGSHAFAADCQNLEGKFFYSNNPSQSVTIEQDACVLTMTFENSGNVGKPVIYQGDGVWRLLSDSKYERNDVASFASENEYRIEKVTTLKRNSTVYHLTERLNLRADGNITLKSHITDGKVSDSAIRLLVRE